ncbi:MAG: potassium transporter TrkG [Pseudomonadota bacterium]
MRISGIPIFALLLGVFAAAMLGPALFAGLERDWRTARLFLFSALFVGFCAAILGQAARRPDRGEASGREELLTLVGVFAAAPAFCAVPIFMILPQLGWSGALFEAIASVTTTGATLIEPPESAPRALHLWRALMGWFGGLATLVAAAAILAPRELVDLPGAVPIRVASERAGSALALGPGGGRTLRAVGRILPLYVALTAVATFALASPGVQSSFVAFCHAMGLVATSGISPVSGGLAAQESRLAEAAAVAVLVLVATRLPYGDALGLPRSGPVARVVSARRDPELKLLLIATAAAAFWLMATGFAGGAFEGAGDALAATWGAAATSLSFLTTAGYVSADWRGAGAWGGGASPGLLLIGLATLGGGVATTAGGVKLFRIYALYRHGAAELSRLPHPRSVDSTRTQGGEIARRAIVNAWVVVMLYMAAFAASLLGLSAGGLGFNDALAAAAAALSNVGPLLALASDADWTDLPPVSRAVAAAAMILGRIELLAAVALLDPGNWRR